MIFHMLCALTSTITITLGINLDHLYTKHQIDRRAMIYIQYIHHVQFQYHEVKTGVLHSPPPSLAMSLVLYKIEQK